VDKLQRKYEMYLVTIAIKVRESDRERQTETHNNEIGVQSYSISFKLTIL